MFHKAIKLEYLQGTSLEVTFEDGQVKQYDMSVLFGKYPQLTALKDRKLFLSGKLHTYGIIWNDDLDIETESIYADGKTVRVDKVPTNIMIAYAVSSARSRAGLSQSQLSEKTGIDQSDISRIERGAANPSMSTLDRIAEALDAELSVSIK